MIRKVVVAALVMLAVGAIAHWGDALHLISVALALPVMLFIMLAVRALRGTGAADELEGYLDNGEASLGSSLLRDGFSGLLIGAVGLLVATAIYSYALPPLYPILVGDCPQLLPKLAIYEETEAWGKAVALIDTRLSRPLDKACRGELAERKARYLIEWSKKLPREQAEQKLLEAARWAEANQLPNYRTIAELMRTQLQPTPTPAQPSVVTPTPSPAPTPQTLPAGATLSISGIDAAYFPPTLFVYLRVADAAGQPIADLAASDVRVYDDGQPVQSFSLAPFSQAPAPLCAGLVIDYSGSMDGEPLVAAKAGARAFLSLLGPNDQVEVIGFNEKAQLLQNWTTDKNVAGQALELLAAKDWTALWDALWLAGGDVAGCSGRKVIVVLSDGADNHSKHTQEEVVAQARRAGLSVFAIGLSSEDYDGAALQALVQAVGGRYSEASDPSELEAYYRQTAGAIRTEHRLALTLPRRADGGTHRLRVEVGGPQPLTAEQTYQDPRS